MVTLVGLYCRPRLKSSWTDAHGHAFGSHAAHGPEGTTDLTDQSFPASGEKTDVEDNMGRNNVFDNSLLTQLIGVGILEFGVVLHR